MTALQRLMTKKKPKYTYTDNSKELWQAMKRLRILSDTSRPHKPQTNGVTERACRHCKEGTKCMLSQSGLTHVWWNFAMEIWNVIRNASEVHSKSDKTPYKVRYKEDFPYEWIPLGAELFFKPESPKDKRKTNKLTEPAGLQGRMIGSWKRRPWSSNNAARAVQRTRYFTQASNNSKSERSRCIIHVQIPTCSWKLEGTTW